MEKYRSRCHMVLLYPDNNDHINALENIKKSYDYAFIIHNRDVWTIEDEKQNSQHVLGENKKEHIHVIIRAHNAIWNTALCKELGIDIRFVEQVKNIDRALQYLIHYNEPDKVQYSYNEVFGTLRTRLIESINKQEKTESEKVLELIEFIDNQEFQISIRTFSTYCAVNGYWPEYRRSAGIFIKILDEHNKKYY